jgi:predicted MFS family arabinose efflux permease
MQFESKAMLRQTPVTQTTTHLFADLKKLPAPYWVLFAGTLINRFGTFVFPFLALYLTRVGFTPAQAGVAIAMFGSGALCGGLFGGWLADRIGRRNTITAAAFAAAGAMAALSQAHAYPAILVTIFVTGFTNAAYGPASSALLADVVPAGLRLRAYAGIRLAINAGFAFGAAVGGFLADHSFFWLFAGDALTTACYGLLALMLLPHGRRTHADQATWCEALGVLRKDRRTQALMLATFAIAIVFHQMSTTYALQGRDAGLTMKAIGALLSWNGLLIVCLELALTSLTRRFAPRRVMALGYLLIGGGMALNGLGSSWAILFVAMTVFTFGEMISIPVSSTYVATLAPPDMRGRYMGLIGISWSAASMLGPSLGMQLFAWHPTVLWLACGGLGLFAAVILTRSSGDGSPPPGSCEPVAERPTNELNQDEALAAVRIKP